MSAHYRDEIRVRGGIGDRPSVTVLIAGNVMLNGLNYGATRAPIPRWARWAWFGVLAGIEAFTVVNNSRYVGACGLAGTPDMPTTAARR